MPLLGEGGTAPAPVYIEARPRDWFSSVLLLICSSEPVSWAAGLSQSLFGHNPVWRSRCSGLVMGMRVAGRAAVQIVAVALLLLPCLSSSSNALPALILWSQAEVGLR